MPRVKKEDLLQKIKEAAEKGDTKTLIRLNKQLISKPASKPKVRSRADLTIPNDESSYIAPSRLPGDDYYGGRKFVDESGREHVYAKRVSMEGVKFVNKFNPAEYDKLPEKLEKFDKKQSKRRVKTPRPGEKGARREPAKKVKAVCSNCRDIFFVYPWECEKVDRESQFRCNSCVRKGR